MNSSWQDRVQLACSTLNYAKQPFVRALEGIKRAGYDCVSFGTTHEGQHVPSHTMDDAEIALIARQLADHGLRAVGGFFAHDIAIAEPGGVEQGLRNLEQFKTLSCPLLIMGGPWSYAKWPTELKSPEQWQAECDAWYAAMDAILPRAAELGIALCLKPHAGLAGHSGRVREVIRRLPDMRLCWDAGNVSFYEGVCPDPGLPAVVQWVRGVCLKDHAGPRANPVFPPLGEGNVDHDEYFRLLAAGGFAGPMMIENLGLRPDETVRSPELTDQRAAEARAYVESRLDAHFSSAPAER